ncbi:MAG: relaxase domain-containing protein, partial [Verrucomicrobia bacterium]|nr:relaxase domain-containing protein [Verrucomicrobiota bacterium]
MLRITRSYSPKSAEQYFDVSLKTSDYYVKQAGVWGGRGAEMLGLEGEVSRKDFVSVASNLKPGGKERLTQRTNTTRKETRVVKGNETVAQVEVVPNRRAGYDFTFSVPKSVSVYLALNDDKELERMIAEALQEAMQEIEKRMEVRVRKGYVEEDRVSPNLVYAYFVHTETRPIDGIPDPHYHIHVFVMNATYDVVEKEWKAIQAGNTCGDRPFYEAYFDDALARRMDAAGYGIRRTENFFELASVNRELVEKFSKRTKQIEEFARENYVVLEAKARALMKATRMAFDDAFAQVVSEIGRKTRKKKEAVVHSNRADLVSHWRTEMTPEELESLRPERVKSTPSQNLLEVAPAKELAIRHLFEQVSVRRELHVAAMLLRRGLARVSLADALGWSKSDPRFTWPDPSGRLVSTREVRDAETRMIQLAAEGQGKHEALGLNKEWAIRHPLIQSSEEQSNAVHHVLRSTDLVTSFRGPAGAGKTELMTEAVTAIETLSRKRVMVLAPSSPSVEVLKGQGFSKADTLQQFQMNPGLQAAIKGQVLWVDEAGFLSVRQMLEIQEFAKEHDCRLILTGDTNQHHSVERGDALRILEESGVIFQALVTKSYRQRVPELREAIEDLSKGKTGEGFDKLERFGVIQELGDEEVRLSAIAAK